MANTVIKQDAETFDSLKLVRAGSAVQLASDPPGLLKFAFKEGHSKSICSFNWVSSVLYVDELLCNRFSFPYAFTRKEVAGLYEVIGSSYIERIRKDLAVSGGTFSNHRHYIYWDVEFSWHITCKDVSLEER